MQRSALDASNRPGRVINNSTSLFECLIYSRAHEILKKFVADFRVDEGRYQDDLAQHFLAYHF